MHDSSHEASSKRNEGSIIGRSNVVQPSELHRAFRGCSKISQYELLGKLGEGTFGEVHRARDIKSGAIFALKKILMHNEKDGFPITALREIKLLKLLSHPNILKLEEMAIEHKPKDEKRIKSVMYMVTPYMDHDLSGLLENPSVHLTEPQIKCYLLQLLEGTRYLHDNHILHRDMKAANLLINNMGNLQIADFGLARHYEGSVPQPGGGGSEARRDYTTLVVTRWYRPPELLMHLRRYTTAIDLWGVGCVFGEMLLGKPILAGDSDARQLELIFELMGPPTEESMPGWDSLPGAEGLKIRPSHPAIFSKFREFGSGAMSLLKELLKLDWKKRINATDALNHPYFKNEPFPAKPGDIPHFEESHELDRRKFRGQKPALPPAPKGGTVGMGPGWGNDNGGGHGGFGNSEGYGGVNHRQQYNGNRHSGQPQSHRNGAAQQYLQNDRRPTWERSRDNSSRPDTRLPARPPPTDHFNNRGSVDGSRSDRDRERQLPRSRAGTSGSGGPRGDVDTYIPSYGAEIGWRHDRRTWDRDDKRHDRDRDRDRLDYDDRARTSTTRSRSRSPVRERLGDRLRERENERDRDIYRR